MMRVGMVANPQGMRERVESPSVTVPAALAEFFSSSLDDAAPMFLLQPGMSAIEYGAPDEVEQLYHSINNVYVSPEGKGQEICQGYICCIKRKASRSIYTALYGTQSGRTCVYLPEVQPTDDESYRKVMTAAFAFGEQIGLMMEPEKAEMSAEQRREWVRRCPVLSERGKV